LTWTKGRKKVGKRDISILTAIALNNKKIITRKKQMNDVVLLQRNAMIKKENNTEWERKLVGVHDHTHLKDKTKDGLGMAL